MAGLEDLYREIILDHYRNPRNRGELDSPPAHRVEGFNPLCGDEVVLTFEVADGRLERLRVGGQGCSISQASASMMSAAATGKTVDEIHRLTRAFKAMMSIHEESIAGVGRTGTTGPQHAPSGHAATSGRSGERDDALEAESETGNATPLALGDLEALRGVVKFPVRIKCATLGWNALASGLNELEQADSRP